MNRIEADQIDALSRHNATLREWLDRAKAERDAALAEAARLTEALDAAGRLVKRKADRAAGKEEA